MKNLSLLVVALAVVSSVSFARTPMRADVAPVLGELAVSQVAEFGEVVKKQDLRHPFTKYVIAIPVTVSTRSACTSFAGQQTSVQPGAGNLQVIKMLGASDPVNDVCIAVMPRPVQTQITVSMNVLTGGFAAADSIQRQIVQIAQLGLYTVTLDMGNDTVTVAPVRRSPR